MHPSMRFFATTGALLLVAACTADTAPTSPVLNTAFDHTGTEPALANLTICKHGSAADFDVNGASHSLADGECRLVSTAAPGTFLDVVVTEVAAETGFEFERTETASRIANSFPTPVEGFSPTVGLRIGPDQGHVLTFFNVPVPSGGGQGCTPGYWKQSHHFDSWTGYDPDDLFSAVFEDAFGNMTLVEVLAQGGGGLKALGRHTVAALLNGANGGVSYDLTAQQVIDGFNAVYPGSKKDYNTLKDQFATFNEQGCPLN